MALGNLEWGFEQKGTKVTKTEWAPWTEWPGMRWRHGTNRTVPLSEEEAVRLKNVFCPIMGES